MPDPHANMPVVHGGHDPLLDVAAEMQKKVADGVHFWMRTAPDLFVGELVDAVFDTRQ